MKTMKGKYRIKYPKKYRGDASEIIFRSSWEYKVMQKLDLNSNVVWWASEPFGIPYVSPIDGKQHRYFPDFMFAVKTKSGEIKEYMIEVKPAAETKPPPQQKRKTKAYLYKVKTWGVNQAKWKAAKRLCEGKSVEFRIWTEKDIPNA